MNKKNQTLKENFIEAFKKYKNNDFKNAEKSCYKILSIDPNHFDSISLLATISFNKKDFNKAKQLMLQAIEIKPNDLAALNNLGTTYRELREAKEAINVYKKVLEIDPNHTKANYNIGLAFYDLRELKLAKTYLQKTVQIQNNFGLAFFSLANVLVDLKEFNEALSCYQKTIELNPNIVSAHNNLGLLYRDMNDFNKAIDCYKKTIEIKPDHYSAHHNLGLIYKELGQFEKSIKSHENAIKHEPHNLMNYHFLSELKREALTTDLKTKIKEILEDKKTKKLNLAYGNFLLSKYERKGKNYEKELTHLIKAHESFYNSYKIKFDHGNKFAFDDVHQINQGAKVNKSNIKKELKVSPIFIVGVPRCGSTLVEKIIASGKKIIPIGEETGIIGHYIPSKILEKQSLNLGDVDEIRKELLEAYKERGLILEKYGNIFTDKSLDNFFYLELIREIFPNSKIINCKRNPLASIVSIFQNNLTKLSWTHDIENIFKYFNNYFEIINNYNKVYPNQIYEVELEKLTSNPEHESKKLMKYCELPWDKKCLEFYKRKDLFSKTASNIQIREAIFKQSIDKYSPYKKFLRKYGEKYSWFN
jgi:tetratricopeptide (TPR) repeat protein